MEQPFYIGQKVVCVKEAFTVRPGQTFQVRDIFNCPKCKNWFIEIGVYEEPPEVQCNCGHFWNYGFGNGAWFLSSNFAPIHEGFEAITFERVMEAEKVSVN